MQTDTRQLHVVPQESPVNPNAFAAFYETSSKGSALQGLDQFCRVMCMYIASHQDTSLFLSVCDNNAA